MSSDNNKNNDNDNNDIFLTAEDGEPLQQDRFKK